jgi:hypothetical protein
MKIQKIIYSEEFEPFKVDYISFQLESIGQTNENMQLKDILKHEDMDQF